MARDRRAQRSSGCRARSSAASAEGSARGAPRHCDYHSGPGRRAEPIRRVRITRSGATTTTPALGILRCTDAVSGGALERRTSTTPSGQGQGAAQFSGCRQPSRPSSGLSCQLPGEVTRVECQPSCTTPGATVTDSFHEPSSPSRKCRSAHLWLRCDIEQMRAIGAPVGPARLAHFRGLAAMRIAVLLIHRSQRSIPC